MINIDGSLKSGSGTIVRFAAGLAALLREPLHLTNIRSRREKPGLRQQHLKALEAISELCHGHLEGANAGSREITFQPGGRISGGKYRWDIGTAGSTTLLVMTVLPAAIFASDPLHLRISGGLFQDFAPSAFHLQHVLLPLLNRMGVTVKLDIIRPGYVPTGGGIIEVGITPLPGKLRPIWLSEQGKIVYIRGTALSSNLKERKVSERMAETCRDRLEKSGLTARIDIVNDDSALQKGAALMIWAETDSGAIIGADRSGAPGRSSEAIGKYVSDSLLEDLSSGATVDRYLADQLIFYAALAEGVSQYRIPRMTEHVETNLWLAETIIGAKTETDNNMVKINGIGYQV